MIDLVCFLSITNNEYVRLVFGDNSIYVYIGIAVAGIAIILAMINIVGGFGVTDRMLRMFSKKKKGGAA